MNGDGFSSPMPPADGQKKDQGSWHYTADAGNLPEDDLIFTWSASEYIAHSKSPLWYAVLIGGTFLLNLLIYLWLKDIFAVLAITCMAVLLGIMAARPPKVVEYKVDKVGLTIGTRSYPYALFRSFMVMQEGAFSSIQFMPLQRFMPPISVYFDPKDEEKIIAVLALHLPMEQQQGRLIDHLAKRIHF